MTEWRAGPLPVTLVYPTQAASSPHRFGPFSIDVALHAAPLEQRHRLVVISHGTGGSAIADHALAQGEDLSDVRARLECLTVFAYGTRSASDAPGRCGRRANGAPPAAAKLASMHWVWAWVNSSMKAPRIVTSPSPPASISSAMRSYGFNILKVNNTDQRLTNTVIVGNSASDPEVILVAGFFKNATRQGDGRVDHVVDVLLGDDYAGRLTNPKQSVAVSGPVCLPTIPGSNASASPTPAPTHS